MKCIRFASILLLAAASDLRRRRSSAGRRIQTRSAAIHQELRLSAIDKSSSLPDFYHTPAATGSRKTRFPRPGALGAVFLAARERNRYLLWQELDAAAPAQIPLEKKYGDYYAAA